MSVANRSAGLILAAGYSSRMGTLKPLLRFGGLTALEQIVDRLRRGGVTEIWVVVGHAAAQIKAALPGLPVQWVQNAYYERGMLSSVLAGVAALREETDAVLLWPVDVPLVSPDTVATLRAAWRKRPAPVVYPVFQQRRGHPPLLDIASVPADTPWNCPGGLRAILQRYHALAREVAVDDPAILLDCDTPADYERLLAHFQAA